MEQTAKLTQSKLVATTVLEPKDDLNERFEQCYNVVNNIRNGMSDREANDALNSYVSKGPLQHEEVQLGLLYAILTDPTACVKSYRDMTLISRDAMSLVLRHTNQLIFEKWLKLLDNTKVQVIWLLRSLVKSSVNGTESVCLSLLRQIAGGDVSQKNIWLTENMLDVFTENRPWLDKFPSLIATVVYTYLRVIEDHNGPLFVTLRQREVELCIGLLREKWTDCIHIGRDLVRLLQNVARISDFEKLWKDMVQNPSAIHAQFTGVQQLMLMRTSRKFLISRLTPDMETKLVFLVTKVKFGQHKRFQDWFQRQYLSTPESQSLRCDLIRYICAVFHPPNELICSDIIPRWAVIGWLLTTCTSNVAATNAKLALFYDWLFFDPEKDSIMNIEPAILVMFHSIRPHPAITATLLDFLCRIMPHFSLPLKVHVKQGIFTSLKTILDKRVLQSLSPLFDNPKLDRDLRALIRENFLEFCSQEVKEEPLNNKDVIEIDNGNHVDNNLSDDHAAFSDEDDDVPIGKLKPSETKFQPIQDSRYQHVDITDILPQLGGDLQDFTEQLQAEKDPEIQCEIMDRIMQTVLNEDEFDQDTATPLATCLCEILSSHFSTSIFPQETDEESLEDSVGSPLFVMFRFLCTLSEEDPSRQPVLQLLGEMYGKQPRIGYHLLYFVKVGKVNDEKMSSYKDFCKSLDNKDLESCLMSDLKLAQEDDIRLFTFIMPDIYTNFPRIAIGNSELLNMIVSAIDGTQLQDLICQILQGHLVMFRKDSFLSVLNASLDWETLEQYFLWQLITAHNIPVEYIMPILPKLDFMSHAEAMSSMLVLLKMEGPSADLLRPVLCRDCKKHDFFTVSILKYWAQEFEDKLADLILSQVNKLSSTPKKRQRTGSTASSKKENASVEQVLSHLDHMRQVCRNISFLNNENIQQALQQIQQSASESLKTRYGDLLALAEDIEDVRTTRVLRGLPVRKAASASAAMGIDNRISRGNKSKKQAQDYSDSATESSEDEDLKPRAKKRKKVIPVDEDSD
ncbi:integrator complex subunit 3-like [Argopecten irradians]|uniref:integrator complex subunit 3-like n=1 Tax=Argopecten irradians TaxID=31199 RepID=UPI003722F3FC